jgi:hypothetical protein
MNKKKRLGKAYQFPKNLWLILLKNTNLAAARLTVRILSPIFKPLRAAQAMSVTAGSWSSCTLADQFSEGRTLHNYKVSAF